MKWKIAARELKEAQILNFQLLMIRIHYIDGTYISNATKFCSDLSKWNEMEYSAKRTKIGSDFISFTFNNSDVSYLCYMSNATKFHSDSSKLE